MIYGVIADVHANSAALAAVLSHGRDVEQWLCCGDCVGYYDDPDGVCTMLQASGVLTVRGNHDAMATGLMPHCDLSAYRLGSLESAATLDWLRSLPEQREIGWSGGSLLLRHASLTDLTTYLYEDSAALKGLTLEEGQILFVGHTHRPLITRRGGGWLVNPGSVGQPRGNDLRPCYLVFDSQTRCFEIRHATYDVAELIARLLAKGWADAELRHLRALLKMGSGSSLA